MLLGHIHKHQSTQIAASNTSQQSTITTMSELCEQPDDPKDDTLCIQAMSQLYLVIDLYLAPAPDIRDYLTVAKPDSARQG